MGRGDDAVVHEIVRHRLLMLNEESANTIMTSSGSPVVVFGRDFNSAVLSAQGEYVFFGRNIEIHAGVIDLLVKELRPRHRGPHGDPGRRHVPLQRPVGGERSSE